MSSVDRRIDVDPDADENAAVAVVEERREVEIGELFDENDEHRPWQDSAGWSGYFARSSTASPTTSKSSGLSGSRSRAGSRMERAVGARGVQGR